MTRTAADIRREFIEFFTDRQGHSFAPSSPVVPHDDPTLLFTNAGMNQFKDVFLGQGDRPYRRAVNSQKCIRAGGKHNDLEDVGKDTYHHTFFEMLGNWSFSDYFKAEAIEWAWTLLTDVWGLDPERLHVTVFGGDEADGLGADDEAAEIWRKFVPEARIGRWGRKENFWEMGESGPCGPCSEIHFDSTPDGSGAALVNRDHPDVIEVWNLVFIQYNRDQRGTLTTLPAKHVDTGMGLERITRVLQGKRSNYDTDLWTPIFDAIRNRAGARPYGGGLDDPIDIAYRVIADHVRCLTVALSDGAAPGNDGRGYVLRRILRRAARHARQTLGTEGPLLADVVPAVVESLGGAFPELAARPDRVANVIREEEESFLRTLDRGLALFDDALAAAREEAGTGPVVIGADDAFKLHDTFGFPIDLTRIMAEERGVGVDESGYEARMEAARAASRHGSTGEAEMTLPPDAIAKLEHLGVKPTRDHDRDTGRPVSATVKAIWNGTDFDDTAHQGRTLAVILDRTSFYAEAGGQVGDRGRIHADVATAGMSPGRGFAPTRGSGEARFEVRETRRFGPYILHIGHIVDGRLQVGEKVMADVALDARRPTMANHTATHLLNQALRDVLDDEVEQRGSLVAPDRLRFDFTASQPLTPEQLDAVEARVRTVIEEDQTVYAADAPLEQARAIAGVRAVFGERYPDPVRVVSVGAPVDDLVASPDRAAWRKHSVEFCGGTHVKSTGQIGMFIIQSEQGLAAGIRRITAVSGVAAVAATQAAAGLAARITELEHAGDHDLDAGFDEILTELDQLGIGATDRARLLPRIDALRDRVKQVRKSASREARSGVVDQARAIAEAASGPIIVEAIDGADKETLLNALDVIRSKCPELAALLLAPNDDDGKVAIAATVPKPLIGRGLKAGDWVREAAKVCGGGGGGRPDMAQAGGKDAAKTPDAIAAARKFAESILG